MLNVKGIVPEKHEVFPTLLWVEWNNNKDKVWFQRNIDFSCCRPEVLRINNSKQEDNQNHQLYSEDSLIAKAQWRLESFLKKNKLIKLNQTKNQNPHQSNNKTHKTKPTPKPSHKQEESWKVILGPVLFPVQERSIMVEGATQPSTSRNEDIIPFT